MRAEIVAIGSELLLGEAVDTNSAWIAARLAEVGVDVHRHTTVGDNLERLTTALREAAGRADALIVTGGLGPTHDDLTRYAVARLAAVELRRDEDLVDYLRAYFDRVGRAMPERNLVQADIPAGARVLEPVGTAAGFALDVTATGGRTATVYCVPGVPREMERMVERTVVPDLVARAGLAVTVSRVVRTSGMSESAVADATADLVERLDAAAADGQAPTLALLATKGETRVRVTAKAATRQAALARLDPIVDELVECLGVAVSGLDDEGAEHAVARLQRRHGWTLAVAESISGGNLGARLVRVPGASDWFRGGLVTYSDEAKTRLAGVDAELIARHSPVSEEVAVALAAGARERLGADVGAAVVGVAGPATQGDRRVGTVCLAALLPGTAPYSRTVTLPARGRPELQEWSAAVALDYLRRRLAETR